MLLTSVRPARLLEYWCILGLLALTGTLLQACAAADRPAAPPHAVAPAVVPSGPAGSGAAPDPDDPWGAYIREAATRFDIPELWIRAVMTRESGGRAFAEGRPITSPAGAIGLMQVMPDTYEELRWRYEFGPDVIDPRDNVLAGTAYLRELYEVFGAPGFLAAYNCGPGCYYQHLTRKRPLPAETRAYHTALTALVSTMAPQRPHDIVSRNTLVAVLPDLPQASPLRASPAALTQVAEARQARLQALAEGTAPAAETIVVAVGAPVPSDGPPAVASPLTPSAQVAPPPALERADPPPTPTHVAEVVAPARLPETKPARHEIPNQTRGLTLSAPVTPPPVTSPRLVIRFVPHGGWKACGSLGRNARACVPAEDLS
jgi:hypothetical protein